MNKEDKLILGTLAGVDLILSPEHYEEYKGTLNEQLEQKNKEIKRLSKEVTKYDEILCERNNEVNRLNNIIDEVKLQLLNKKDIVEKSKYFKLVYYIDWNMKHEWDKRIANKIDEIINIIDEENK